MQENIDTTNTTVSRRFPALAQLFVLLLMLGGLFGGFVFSGVGQKEAATFTPPSTPRGADDEGSLPIITTITPGPLTATAVYVYDVRTGRALYEENPDRILPLASITKLMTTLVAFDLMSPNTKVTVPVSATQQQSSSGLSAGETFTHDTLQQFAMLASSNDAAYSLAAAAGGILTEDRDPMATFIEAMNITAEELNLDTLTFYNATGLDRSATEAGAYGSARDVTFLMDHILKHAPTVLSATTDNRERVYNTTGGYHDAENTNPIINRIPNLIGSKTGYTDLAGGNLTIAFDAGFDRPIIVTVLGSGYDERFTDVLTLVAAVRTAFEEATSDVTTNQ